jgi:hypothetical protein
MMNFKRCIRCGVDRTMNYYRACKWQSDGRAPTCEVCRAAASKERYESRMKERRRANRTHFCRTCADLPHRREQPVCRGCGKPWQPEEATRPDGWQRNTEEVYW